jgi:Uma2 family endonuclease
MVSTQRTLITAEEFLDISAELSARGESCELINGEVVKMPPAGGSHGFTAHKTSLRLGNYVERNDLGYVFAAETGFFLRRNPDTVRAPDVAFIRKDRLRQDELPTGFVETTPDLVVEVVSPNDRAADVQSKAAEWLQAGARLVWVLYPSTRSIMIYHSPKDVRMLSGDDILDGKPVFDDFEVPVRELFT